MPVWDLPSKRHRRELEQATDVYTYDVLPNALKNQVRLILRDGLGNPELSDIRARDKPEEPYEYVVDTLRREYGVMSLTGELGRRWPSDELDRFLSTTGDIQCVLDAVEVSFFVIKSLYPARIDDLVMELNHRFRENQVGYQYQFDDEHDDRGIVIKVSSQFLHEEVVTPALSLLSGAANSGAQQEFLAAHEHFRHGKHKECINECLKAMESLMRGICDRQGWQYDEKIQAKGLIDICFQKHLIPSYWQSNFSSLRSLLESGVPTGRNKTSAHGQGSNVVDVPEHITAFILHMTASALVFLRESERILNG